jgi:hypothetical protein
MMTRYDPDRGPDPDEWWQLDETTRIDLVLKYHRRDPPETSRVRLHATLHVIIENQLAMREPVVVETLGRLRQEGLSRHDAIHAIASVLAAHVHHVLTTGVSEERQDINQAYAEALRTLTATHRDA